MLNLNIDKHFFLLFKKGCDGSLLLNGPEKSAVPNQSVRGYNVIDSCKASLEQKCPKIVSCTDILVIATRVSVYLVSV